MRVHDREKVSYGGDEHVLDLSGVEQLVEAGQTRAIAEAMQHLAATAGQGQGQGRSGGEGDGGLRGLLESLCAQVSRPLSNPYLGPYLGTYQAPI